MTQQVRVAFYRRVSTVGHGQDVNAQLEELQAVARQRGWTVARDYVDNGVSGAKESRPALNKLLRDTAGGKIDLVAVVRLDRLGRSLGHLIRVLDQLSAHGCGFVSIRDSGIDTTTASGRMMIHLLGAFAEFERQIIRERVLAGVTRARAKGKRFGRPPRQDLDAVAAKRLRAEGRSLNYIADALKCGKGTVIRLIEG